MEEHNRSAGSSTGSLKGRGQVCRVPTIVRIMQTNMVDELSELWTKGENKGGIERVIKQKAWGSVAEERLKDMGADMVVPLNPKISAVRLL